MGIGEKDFHGTAYLPWTVSPEEYWGYEGETILDKASEKPTVQDAVTRKDAPGRIAKRDTERWGLLKKMYPNDNRN